MSGAAIEMTAHEHGDTGTVMRYQLKSTGHSSERYGVCEVCGQHASEVFHLTSYMLYERKGRGALNGFGWTCGIDLFGHADCLRARRIGAPVMTLNPEYARYRDANFRARANGVEILIGRDTQGYKAYIADRYEGLFPTLARAWRFASTAVAHPEQRRPITEFA